MAITFSSDPADFVKKRKVTNQGTKRGEDTYTLPPNPELPILKPLSKPRTDVTVEVEARRNRQREHMDNKARARLGRDIEPASVSIGHVAVRQNTLASDARTVVARQLRADPAEIAWSSTVNLATASQVLDMAKKASMAKDPIGEWRRVVGNMQPRIQSPTREVPREMHIRPGSESNHRMVSLGFHKKDSKNEAASEWISKAVAGTLPNRQTRCAVTGRSLIREKMVRGQRVWFVDSPIGGMDGTTAKNVVAAAAVTAGAAAGMMVGEQPRIVHELAQNASEWLSLAIASEHPIFAAVAQQLLSENAAEAPSAEVWQRVGQLLQPSA